MKKENRSARNYKSEKLKKTWAKYFRLAEKAYREVHW